jgi:hypothetical protein
LAFNDGVPYFSKTWTSCLEPATKEQRDFLFQTIKEAGYKWNTEEKKLEKLIVPKFKVGDKIKEKNERFPSTRTIYNYVEGIGYYTTIHDWVRIEDQDDWELVSNKFDITTLKPFDKVLVAHNKGEWHIQFFEKYSPTSKLPFICIGGSVYQKCVPYEENKHLMDTTNDCDEYYKIWKN